MKKPPLVISIQSQVVFGRVGNSAAIFPMQAAGLEVAAIPTVLFSNTPHYPTLRGCPTPPEIFADLLTGAEERGLPARASFVLSGYIGSVEVARMAARFVAGAKAANSGLRYICDPVMGDTGPGLYVPPEIAAIMRADLLPQADLATPNQFELGWLTGLDIHTLADLHRARQRLNMSPQALLIATGCKLDDTPEGMIESVILSGHGETRHPTPYLPIFLSGTGDLYTGLLTAGLGGGATPAQAVEQAQRLTALALKRARDLGAKEVVLSDPAFRRALLELSPPE